MDVSRESIGRDYMEMKWSDNSLSRFDQDTMHNYASYCADL